jgi:hypothetical protein
MLINHAISLHYPCCGQRSWFYANIDTERTNFFHITCNRCGREYSVTTSFFRAPEHITYHNRIEWQLADPKAEISNTSISINNSVLFTGYGGINQYADKQYRGMKQDKKELEEFKAALTTQTIPVKAPVAPAQTIQYCLTLKFPCRTTRSWAYVNINPDQLNVFRITCRRCKTVYIVSLNLVHSLKSKIYHPKIIWELDPLFKIGGPLPKKTVMPYN